MTIAIAIVGGLALTCAFLTIIDVIFLGPKLPSFLGFALIIALFVLALVK